MKSIKIIISIVFLFVAIACNPDEFLDQSPLDEYTSGSVFKTEEDIILASNFLYTFLPHLDQRFGESRLFLWTDDGWRRNGGREGSDLNWLASDEFLDFYHYDQIRHCNELIARIPEAQFATPGLDEQVRSEARFIRAWIYERMVFLHGDVPLLTEPQNLDFLPEREGQRLEVFNFIVAELTEIADFLPESYNNASQGRITKWAALALLARANLNAVGWHPDPNALYDAAESACRKIILESGLMLDNGIDGFSRLFTHHSDLVSGSEPSSAIILSRNYIDNVLPYDEMSIKCLPRGSFRGTGGERPRNNQTQYGATWNLVSSFQTINGLAPSEDPSYDPSNPFENRDPRLRASFILPGDSLQSIDGGGTEFYTFQPHPDLATVNADRADRGTGIDTGYLIRKYSGLSLEDNATLEIMNNSMGHADHKIIRYAEVLLMLAEALAADNNSECLNYINMVRERVGMPPYNNIGDVPISVMNGTTGNQYIDAVLLERRYEFAGEAVQRMFDIWRYKLGNQVYGPVEGMPQDPNLPGDLVGPKTTFANTTRVWDDRYYLLPIPQEALDRNPNIQNNQGW